MPRALLVGGVVSALLVGPAMAHQHNGNPDATNPADPNSSPDRHDVTLSKSVSIKKSKVHPCSSNFGSVCDRTNTGNGSTSMGMSVITSPAFFVPTDIGRPISGTNIPLNATILNVISANQVQITGGATGNAVGTATFTVLPVIITVGAPSFNGTATGTPDVAIILCNAEVVTAVADGGEGDPSHGCDYGNAKGYASHGLPASSGTFLLSSGNLTSTVDLDMPSSEVLTDTTGVVGSNFNPNGVCPPTTTQIQAGWNCTISVAEFSGAHVGDRVVYLKSPIPTVTFSGGNATVTGVRFPCKTIQPDDPAVVGHQGSCLTAWTNKTILIKRVATGLLEGGAITPTSQTAGVNGNYTINFHMPTLMHPGELYKIIPHAQSCAFNQGNAGYPGTGSWIVKSCESGTFNAAGVLFTA